MQVITSILESCQRINFEINLFDVLKGLSILILILVVMLIEKKILSTVRKESIIDERVRETSARIARVVAEIEEFKEFPDEEEPTPKLTQSQTLGESPADQDVSTLGTQEESDKLPKAKKTRAMSMEERWADFDKKRAIRNSA